ncbi:hypothetical protein CLU79DRAFT_507130 [Phycomyces nitens]|nr:hypothetical protein CLU79DRAFT_507130 [Phycomyces nitens]
MSPLLSPSPYTHKKNKWGLSRLFRRMLGISPSKSKTHPANLLSAQESGTGIHYTATGQAIHIVSNVGTPGEVPTSYDREEILSRIHGASSIGSDTSSSQSVQLETELIASQSQIWVFRENDDSRYGPNVWSVFDYGNQKVLFEHASKILSNMHVEDTLDLYDSHIKHGIIPVMIVPAQNKGYYLSNISTESVTKITINCLDNTPTTRFVFRTDGLTSPFSIV